MRAIRFAVLLIIAAIVPGALVHATCAPGSCCIEAECCSAVRMCHTGEGCTCTFSCGEYRDLKRAVERYKAAGNKYIAAP